MIRIIIGRNAAEKVHLHDRKKIFAAVAVGFYVIGLIKVFLYRDQGVIESALLVIYHPLGGVGSHFSHPIVPYFIGGPLLVKKVFQVFGVMIATFAGTAGQGNH